MCKLRTGLVAKCINYLFTNRKRQLNLVNQRLRVITTSKDHPFIRRFQVVTTFWSMLVDAQVSQDAAFFAFNRRKLVVRDTSGAALRSFLSLSLAVLHGLLDASEQQLWMALLRVQCHFDTTRWAPACCAAMCHMCAHADSMCRLWTLSSVI